VRRPTEDFASSKKPAPKLLKLSKDIDAAKTALVFFIGIASLILFLF
jgi:hypothetical protein